MKYLEDKHILNLSFYLFVFIYCLSFSYSVSNTNSCLNIDEGFLDGDRKVMLTGDILDSSENVCMNITTSNFVFDCANHTIDGIDTPNSKGFFVVGYNNITFQNCIVSNWGNSFKFTSSSGLNFFNITALSSTSYSFYFTSWTSNILFDNVDILDSTTYTGIYFIGTRNVVMKNSRLYNNRNDFSYHIGSTLDCSKTYVNVTDDSGKFHMFFNDTVNIDGWTNISSVTICNGPNSVVENMVYDAGDDQGNFLGFHLSPYSVAKNLSLSNFRDGIYTSTYTTVRDSVFNSISSSSVDVSDYGFVFNNSFLNSVRGILLRSWDKNIIISNNYFDNNGEGIRFFHNPTNITVKNSVFFSNTRDLYFDDYIGEFPDEIYIYNNSFFSTNIDADFEVNSSTGMIYFNYSVPGVGNIGNYWGDSGVCNVNVSRDGFYVCVDPSYKSINVVANMYDYAPIVGTYEVVPPQLNSNVNVFDFSDNLFFSVLLIFLSFFLF